MRQVPRDRSRDRVVRVGGPPAEQLRRFVAVEHDVLIHGPGDAEILWHGVVGDPDQAGLVAGRGEDLPGPAAHGPDGRLADVDDLAYGSFGGERGQYGRGD